MDKNKICYYIYDRKLVDISRNIPNVGNRAAVVQSLIATYSLLEKCKISTCEEATDEDLLSFHSSDYLECLKKAEKSSDLEKITDSHDFSDFNLGYDCPLFENIYKFAKLIAGSSLTAAKKLVVNNFQVRRKVQASYALSSQPKSYLRFKNGLRLSKLSKDRSAFDMPSDFSAEEFEDNEQNIVNSDRTQRKTYEVEVTQLNSNFFPISINWFGGWHHAQRDEAGGFCYVNDIVISIQYLLKYYKKILYVDLDIHHGNGVENAFLFSPRVLTFSVHKYEAGFYPASGSLEDIGKGSGKFYAVNVPLKDGITDNTYFECGADCLAGDPLGGFNLTLDGIGKCVTLILDHKLPTMVLGGGGYNIPNAARCWTYLTSLILDCPVSDVIPDNSFLHLYGPEYELRIAPGLRKDENTQAYLKSVVATVFQNLDKISGELVAVPRH